MDQSDEMVTKYGRIGRKTVIVEDRQDAEIE